MSFSQFTNKIASDYQPPGASLLTFIWPLQKWILQNCILRADISHSLDAPPSNACHQLATPLFPIKKCR